MSFVNLNGKLQPGNGLTLNASNSALRYGFGLFETMLVQETRILLASDHWERLFEGMKQLDFHLPSHFNSDQLQQEVLKTVHKNGLQRLCRVRLQVFSEMEGLFSQEKKLPQFFIECFKLEDAAYAWNENGWVCGFAEGILKSNDSYSHLKTCNALIYVAAAQQAKSNKWNDALISNTGKHIIESTIANIFWVKDGKLYTPPLSEGCIAGVMRRHLIRECRRKNISVSEAPLDPGTLRAADEVFLTNAIRRIKWVKTAGETSYHPPTVSRAIYNLLFNC